MNEENKSSKKTLQTGPNERESELHERANLSVSQRYHRHQRHKYKCYGDSVRFVASLSKTIDIPEIDEFIRLAMVYSVYGGVYWWETNYLTIYANSERLCC